MAYKIMTVVEQKQNNGSTYTFYKKKDTDGYMRVFEAADKAELETEVESMLNEGGYSKKQFIIVEQLDYNLDTDITGD
jgi:hypothetical protein